MPAARAGAPPNNSPVATDTQRVKSKTVPLMEASLARVVKRLAKAMSTSVPIQAINRPKAPPAMAKRVCSVINCWASLPRRAPSAERTASSWVRFVMRARARFATFAQAISRTRPAVPRRMRSVGRAF